MFVHADIIANLQQNQQYQEQSIRNLSERQQFHRLNQMIMPLIIKLTNIMIIYGLITNSALLIGAIFIPNTNLKWINFTVYIYELLLVIFNHKIIKINKHIPKMIKSIFDTSCYVGKCILCNYNLNIQTDYPYNIYYETCGAMFIFSNILTIIISISIIVYLYKNLNMEDYRSAANIFINVSKNPDLIDTCVVCLENFDTDSSLAELKCGHNYHFNCLEEWIKCGHEECPLCRVKIESKKEAEIEAKIDSV